MRILLVHQFGHCIGGIEVYLRRLAPELAARGHEIVLLHEQPVPPGVEPITPATVARWCAGERTVESILTAIREWRPDVLYAHQLVAPALLDPLLDEHPSVYFAHCYVGVCISGAKSWKRPRPVPCRRVLGPGCLAHYLPHGCGGLDPLVMWRLYRNQRRDQQRLRAFDRIVTHSDAMRDEYLRHGFPPGRVMKIPFWIPGGPRTAAGAEAKPQTGGDTRAFPRPGEAVRLLFLGRCEAVKGGALLLDALAPLARELGRPVELVVAGDGPERGRWERRARRIERLNPAVRIRFTGWLEGAQRDEAINRAHVLAYPSFWPEPFGMAGVEAGFHGVPSVAFDVGGVREWLKDGVNGHLAQGERPCAADLAAALARAVSDPAHYASLRRGALQAARIFAPDPHLAALERVLDEVRAWRDTGPRPGGICRRTN